MADIGKLNIEIEANADKATQSLKGLASAMRELVIPDVNGLNEFTKSMKKLGKVTIDPSLANSLKEISGINFEGKSFEPLTKMIHQFGLKSTATAMERMDELGDSVSRLMTKMANLPEVSDNTIRMTEALAEFTANGGKVGSAATKIAKGLDKIDNSAKKTKKSIKNIGLVNLTHYATDIAVLFTQSITGAIRDGINGMLEYASSLVETQNVVERTFGNSQQVIEDFARTSIEMYGMNQLEAKQMIGMYQAMGTSLGETKERMASVSTSLGALVGDYASFFNMDVSKVSDDFSAIFTGQTKAMRKYGIDLTNAQLQTFADEQGWDVQVKSLSQYNKAIIRYNYLVSRSKDILGDFQRTSGSYANQAKVMKEQFADFFGTLAQIGTSVVAPLLQMINTLVGKMRQFAEQLVAFLNLGNSISFGGGVVEGLEDMEDYSDAVDDTTDSLKKLKSYTTGIDELNVLKPNEDTSSADTGLESLGSDWDTDWWNSLEKGEKEVYDFTELIEHLQWVFEPTIEGFKKLYSEGIKPTVEVAKETLSEFWEEYFEPLIHWNFRVAIPVTLEVINDIMKDIEVVIAPIRSLFRDVFDDIRDSGITDLFLNLAQVADDLHLKLLNLAANFLGFLEPTEKTIAIIVTALIAFVNGALSKASGVVGNILDVVNDLGDSIYAMFYKNGVMDALANLKAEVTPFMNQLGSALMNIVGVVGSILKIIEPIMVYVVKLTTLGLTNLINLLTKALELLEKPLDWISSKLEKLADWLSGVGGKFGDWVKNLIGLGEEETEVEVKVKPNTEETQEVLNNTELVIEPKIATESVVASASEAIKEINESEDLKIEPKIATESVIATISEAIKAVNETEDIKIEPQIATESIPEQVNEVVATMSEAIKEVNESEGTPKIKVEADWSDMYGDIKIRHSEIMEELDQESEALSQKANEMGTNVATSLNTGLANGNEVVKETVGTMATDIKTTMESEKTGLGIKGTTSLVFENYGANVTTGLKTGVEKNKQASVEATGVWASDVNTAFNTQANGSVWEGYAKNICDGFKSGLGKYAHIAIEAMRDLANDLQEEFTEEMDINSPSKVFEEYGGYLVEGLNQGIVSDTSAIDKWLEDLKNAVSNFSLNLSGMSLTTPIRTSADMSGFYQGIERAQSVGMSTSLNNYSQQAIQVEIPKISVEIDSREIARANYKGQKQLGYQIHK